MKHTIITVIIFLFLAACDNTGDRSSGSLPDGNTYVPYIIAYSADGHDISQFLEWEWTQAGTDFIWFFQTDGSVSVTHCCGDVIDRQYNYLFQGNVLVTYGYETSFDKIEATTFTMADDGLSFTRDNGTIFIRGKARDSSGSTLGLSNVLLGTWHDEDGTEYEFSPDTGLRINSEQYGYLVRYAELLPLGPLVDGTDAVLEKYKFNRKGNLLYLRCSDGQKYTLSLLE